MSDRNMPIYMKPEDWVEAYKDEVPHWAEDPQPSPLAKEMLKMLGKESGNKILEVGAGDGRDSIFFAGKGNDVTGIDIVPKAVEMAIENAKRAGMPGEIDFGVGNAEELEFKDGSFDGVYSLSVLHATDLKLSLKEISRVLKTNGKALIYLYEKTVDKGKEYWFTKREDVGKLLEKNNLSVEDNWDFIHDGHEGEKTTVLVYKLTKK